MISHKVLGFANHISEKKKESGSGSRDWWDWAL